MTHISLFLLLADRGQFQNLGARFRSAEVVGTGQILLMVSVVLAVLFSGLMAVQLLRWKRQRDAHNPWALFRELCSAHHLKATDRRLLAQLAKGQKLQQPALLFVEPERFDTNRLANQSDAKPLQLIRDRLFGQHLKQENE